MAKRRRKPLYTSGELSYLDRTREERRRRRPGSYRVSQGAGRGHRKVGRRKRALGFLGDHPGMTRRRKRR